LEKSACVQPRLSSAWHTGLSGGAPDSVRCARLDSGEHATLGNIWRRTAIIHRIVWWCTGLSGEPTFASATVGRAIRGRRVARANSRQGAPDCVRKGNRSTPDRLQWMSGGAPDCPVRHPTEGKDSLPCWLPTAPSCLGAIKGTSRRMEESSKHSLSNSKSPHSVSTHLIDRVNDLSSVLAVNSLCFI
jgi:hypothetical protein